MKHMGFLLLMTGLLLSACKKEPSNPAPTNKPSSSGNPLTAPVDYLGEVAKGKKTTEKTLDTAALNQTVQLFAAQEGRYPKTLNELVGPEYLSKLPEPPAGMKFDYNPTTGQVKVVPK
jgi:hypothetical protein